MAKVAFYFDEVQFTLKERRRLKSFIEALFKKEGTLLQELNYIFVTDAFLLQMNKEQLNHHYYTDIITFSLNSPQKPVIGEAYISIDRVRDNAGQYGHSFNRELHRVIFHGSLHLCGYKDKSPKDIKEMREAEDKYLSLFFK